ncbi:hypothetical protein [Terrabacter sp. NPDC080008]|uniref:hypothetical protein n=1 Tax=Terrabacter sp. NPDC080008 TaxID=3155176 RepID=UPI00344B9BFD
MKTSAAAPARPSTAPRRRLARLAALGLAAPVLALAACSGESPVAAGGTTPASSAPAGTTAPTPSTPAPDTSTTAATPAPTTTTDGPASDKVAYANIDAVIKDPDLGHTITATRIARHLKWPGGQPVGAEQFEIVGVRVIAQAGSRYSARIDPAMLSLVAANPAQTITPTSEFKNRWGAVALGTAQRSQTSTGWVFFKVDRGTTSSLKLAFNRPAYEVSTTGKNIPAKTFSAVLVK